MYEVEELFDKRSIVGAKLEYILDEKNCTKSELCKKTGVSRPTIDKVLAGILTNKKNYEKHMRKIIKYLQITPDILLGNKTSNQNKVREIRSIYRITTDEISKMTGISLERLKEIESGKIASVAELRDIGMILCTSSNVLTDKAFFEPTIERLNGFWGHVGICLNNTNEYLWYPIAKNTSSLIYRMINNKHIVIPCMNSKVLLLCMENIRDLILLDDVCDDPIGVNFDKNVNCGEIPLVVYEALEDYMYGDCMSNNKISKKLKMVLDKYIEINKWTEEDILDILNASIVYYNDGNKRNLYIDFTIDDSVSNGIMGIYNFETSDFLDNIMIINEIYGYDTLLNLKNVSMLEVPLLKLEDRINELQKEMLE